MNWKVYIILCSDNSLYTGITTDMERRLGQHATGCGAKYFRGRQPRQLVYLESGHSRSSAGTREALIKSMKHTDKLALVSAAGNELADSEDSNTEKGTNV
jgi:putative endonuclease